MGAVAHLLSEEGLKVGAFKPISVRARDKWNGLLAHEVEFLAFCARTNTPFTTINPLAYVTDAPPVIGAARERKPVDFDRIRKAYEQICSESDVVLIEGLDGPRTPLTDEYDLLDLAAEFRLPILLVAGYDPSIINTTLMAVDCIQAANLRLSGIVINGYDVPRCESVMGNTAPALISQFTHIPILAETPHDETASVESQDLGELILPALSNTDWKSLVR